MRALSPSACPAVGQKSARRLASVSVSALFLLFPLLAAAEPANHAAAAQVPAAPTSRDALLHHQPSEAMVAQGQIRRYGRAEVERRQRETQSEIDRIYIDVMSRSALPNRQ
jgi:hypothetical protein